MAGIIAGRTRYTSVMKFRAGIRHLRPQRELRRRQGAVPVAADGDPLRAPRDARGAGDRLAPATRTRCARRSTRSRRTTSAASTYDGTYEDLFFYVERLVIAGLRRRCRRPAAHRAQPQRHRHDDVPDAAARVRPRAARRRRSSCGASLLDLVDRHRDTILAVHTHTQRAQPTHGRALPAGRHRAARARRVAAEGARTSARTAIRSAPARSPAPAFRSIAS